MAYEQRNNSGSLFLNDRKEKENQPDSTGTAMIDGKMYRMSAWRKQAKGGGKSRLSIEFTSADEMKQTSKGRVEPETEEVPF